MTSTIDTVMPMSPYLRSLPEQGRTCSSASSGFRDGDRFLVARQRDTERWSLISGNFELGETPQEAVAREVSEKLGVSPDIGEIIGAYGGKPLRTALPNRDQNAHCRALLSYSNKRS